MIKKSPPIFFITGMIGSGKSTVANYFKYRNYEVIKMDDYAKSFINRNSDVKIELIKYFGKNVLDDKGKVDNQELKKVYFKEEHKNDRIKFELFLDDLIIKDIKEILHNRESMSPIFFEIPSTERIVNLVKAFNPIRIIYVTVSDETRKERLLNRGMTEEDIEERLKTQSIDFTVNESILPKISVIINNGTEEELFDQVTTYIQDTLLFLLPNDCKRDMTFNYIKKMPGFVLSNTWCYVFYNSTGCAGCPFPCNSSDKNYIDATKNNIRRINHENN